MRHRTVLSLSATLLLGALGCAGQDAPPAGATSGDQPVAQQSDHPALQRRNPRYKLSRSDSFDLTFPLSPEFNQTGLIVQPDGYVSLLSVGDVYVEGKTIPELAETIKMAYSKILHDPVVNVTLKDFEKPYFMALGQVQKPGKYDLRGETTLTQAVALAGGFSVKGAKTSQVLLFRQVSDDWIEVRKIDVKKMLSGKDLREDVHLRPGDMLYVPTSAYSKVEEFIPKANLGIYMPY
jgi:polysaccharide biosynthesis/export protein